MRTNDELLIDYLDGQLTREESIHLDLVLQTDRLVAENMEYLRLALDTVRIEGITGRVATVRRSLIKTQHVPDNPTAVVRSMNVFRMSMRVAAIFTVFAFSAVLYKYISVNNQSVYNKQFTGYELGTTRGADTQDAEGEAYLNKSWNKVISLYNSKNNKSNKSAFLAAMAEMQLNHFPQAITLFENVLRSGDNSFQEEAEYYVSLAYLVNHEEDKGIQMLDKIKAEPSHIYYPLAYKISAIDLKIIELKRIKK